MRNFRKTKKRGGFNYIQNIYSCGVNTTKKGKITKVTKTKCYKNFAEDNNLFVVETADDGNCFYDTLSKYGARTGNRSVNKGHLELRREIIGSMLKPERLEELAPFFVENRPIGPEANGGIEVNPVAELTKFLKPYQWAGWMGDIVPQIAAQVLGINITIFDVREINNNNDSIPNRIDKLFFSGGGNEVQTVIMLRTDGSHFRLLWPKDAPVLPRGRKVATKEEKNITNTLIENLSKIKLANKPIREVSKSPPRYRLRSNKQPTKRVPSPLNKRVTRVKKANKNSEDDNMQRAIRASLVNQHQPIRRPGAALSNNFYTTFASFETK